MPEGLKETPLAKRYRKSSYRVTILTKNKNHTGKKKEYNLGMAMLFRNFHQKRCIDHKIFT